MSKQKPDLAFKEFKDFVKKVEAETNAPVKTEKNKTSTTKPEDWFWDDDFNDFLYGGEKND
jgi:hypothetical protein